mmetsp:Transcript_36413/g.86478  ORF Transcript_36413/g.86478 Transcript_36413/m.86478 type:complete len:362 (-) Transcript_36413:466-1551(-)
MSAAAPRQPMPWAEHHTVPRGVGGSCSSRRKEGVPGIALGRTRAGLRARTRERRHRPLCSLCLGGSRKDKQRLWLPSIQGMRRGGGRRTVGLEAGVGAGLGISQLLLLLSSSSCGAVLGLQRTRSSCMGNRPLAGSAPLPGGRTLWARTALPPRRWAGGGQGGCAPRGVHGLLNVRQIMVPPMAPCSPAQVSPRKIRGGSPGRSSPRPWNGGRVLNTGGLLPAERARTPLVGSGRAESTTRPQRYPTTADLLARRLAVVGGADKEGGAHGTGRSSGAEGGAPACKGGRSGSRTALPSGRRPAARNKGQPTLAERTRKAPPRGRSSATSGREAAGRESPQSSRCLSDANEGKQQRANLPGST